MPREGIETRIQRLIDRLTLPRAIRAIVLLAMSLVLVGAAFERLVEPETFTSYGRALWWAVVTVATVGYGDVVPETVGGRVVAAFVMLAALSLIPTVTSVIVSVLVSKRAEADRERHEVERRETLDGLARIEERLDRLEAR